MPCGKWKKLINLIKYFLITEERYLVIGQIIAVDSGRFKLF